MTTDDRTDLHVADFKLSITRALADQLADAIAALTPVPLTPSTLELLEPRPGVYELFHDGARVYVGKASQSLPRRLRKHLKKLSGRSNLGMDPVHFLCLYVDEDLEASAPERMLISKYREEGVVAWNTNGFGNNDPGRRRDRSLVRANHFDSLFPVNLDYELAVEGLGSLADASTYLKELKSALPFNLRFEMKDPTAVTQLKDAGVVPVSGPAPARSHLAVIFAALPLGWQLTVLPGYVILYPNTEILESAVEWWRRGPNGHLVVTPGLNRRAAPAVVPEVSADED